MLKLVGIIVFIFLLFIGVKFVRKPEKNNSGYISNDIKGYLAILIAVITLVYSAVAIVSEGSALTKKCFGDRDELYYKTAGIYILNPVCSYEKVSVAEEFVKFYTEEDLSNAPLSADKLRMNTVVNMPVSVNASVTPYLLNVYLTEERYKESVIKNSVWDAIRRGFSKYYWEIPQKEQQLEGVEYRDITVSRDLLVEDIKREFSKIVLKKLTDAGIPEELAKTAFKVGYPTISGITPPESVSASIEEQKKAEAELKRQTTITSVAEKKAARGIQEGNRVKNLLNQIPGFNSETATVEETALIINAISGLTNAESLEKGVTEGKIEVWVVDGGNPSVSPKK